MSLLDGIKINLGGTDYVVPPINLRLFFKLEADIKALSDPASIPLVEYMRSAVTVLVAVLQRNYPDMTAELVEESVDFAELPTVVKAIFGQSGFESRPLAVTAEQPSLSVEVS